MQLRSSCAWCSTSAQSKEPLELLTVEPDLNMAGGIYGNSAASPTRRTYTPTVRLC